MDTKSLGMRFDIPEWELIVVAARQEQVLVPAWCRSRLERIWAIDKEHLNQKFPNYKGGFGKSFTLSLPRETCEKYRKLAHALQISLSRWARTRLVQIAMLEKLNAGK